MIILSISVIECQQPFNLFQGLQFPQPEKPLPPKTRVGRTPNQKLHSCCRKLPQADLECKRRFCDFSALSSNTVSCYFYTSNSTICKNYRSYSSYQHVHQEDLQ